MKKYPTLRSLSYTDYDNYEAVIEKRKSNDSTVLTGLYIQPFDSKKGILLNQENELFFLVLPKTSLLKDKLNENSRYINELMNRLPEFSKENIFYRLLIEEIKASNDIEGVQSTRKEIRDAISVILKKSEEDKRFKSLVYQYMNFRKDEFSKIKSIEDIREIYDKLLKGEVSDEDMLSSNELFRNEPVYIFEPKTGKKTHQGATGEDRIKSSLKNLVEFMNRDDVPTFEKSFVSHLFFENVHPFYDGNGRTGRFMLCSYLARKLDYLSAIGVSVAILENKNKYYKAFQEASHPKNMGESTFFILDMFDILLRAQDKILSSLKNEETKLTALREIIEKSIENNDDRAVLYSLAQAKLYDELKILTDTTLAKIISVSRQKVKMILQRLKDKGYIEQVKQKPSIHQITGSFWNEIENKLTL